MSVSALKKEMSDEATLAKKKADKHELKKVALLGIGILLGIFPLFVLFPLAICFEIKSASNAEKITELRKDIRKLDAINSDIVSIQETVKTLSKPPEKISKKEEEQARQKIDQKIDTVKNFADELNLKLAQKEKPQEEKHSLGPG